MASKIFRDPLYNYISIDRTRDDWLVRLINCREMQRLRRIHQLGLSSYTYPGADHSRLSHSLGVLHLMQIALEHIQRQHKDAQVNNAVLMLLGAALLHDAGHGPFSHAFEQCLGIDHEYWSRRIILDEASECHAVLKSVEPYLPQRVADLIDPNNHVWPSWMKYLLSSQLDVDRLDYLRRDSFFSGAGYGHYDWYRLLTTIELRGSDEVDRTIAWPNKSLMAVEEYVFARYYMYQNVYLHKTTRGFEKLLVAIWRRAQSMDAKTANLLTAFVPFWPGGDPAVADYVRLEEFTVLQQVQIWTEHPDAVLADLARRFLYRRQFVAVEPPRACLGTGNEFDNEGVERWIYSLIELVRRCGFEPDAYCLRDEVKPKYHQPYMPEKEGDDQSAKNAIRISVDSNSPPVEVSQLCPRLKPLFDSTSGLIRYYVPREIRSDIHRMNAGWRQI